MYEEKKWGWEIRVRVEKRREVLCNFLCMTVCFVGLRVCARACVEGITSDLYKWSSQCVSQEG